MAPAQGAKGAAAVGYSDFQREDRSVSYVVTPQKSDGSSLLGFSNLAFSVLDCCNDVP